MEDRLSRLIQGNSEVNRVQIVKEWKNQGKKVIGIMSSYVPEEIVTAAGMLPWRITGSWGENISHARVYRSESSCSFCNHVLESFLSGKFDFLDGIIITDIDQDLLRLWDVLVALKVKPFCHAMHIPFVDSELNYQFFAQEIKRLIGKLEESFGCNISQDSVYNILKVYDKTRNLLKQAYELRKKEIPPFSGAEILGITTACSIMPKERFNSELETLLPYLEKRRTGLKQLHPRLLVTSEMLDNPAYLNLVEEECLIAMDDLDTGSRYLNQQIDLASEDPVYAIARGYVSSHGSPRMASWDKQILQIINWTKEYNIDGVLSLPLTWCYPQRFRMPFLHQKLDEAGIPHISFEREYHLANSGQLRTRIGAFIEMLSTK